MSTAISYFVAFVLFLVYAQSVVAGIITSIVFLILLLVIVIFTISIKELKGDRS